MARAKLDLGYCEIRSPVSGRAGNLLVHPGNLIKVNDVALVVINQVAPIFVSFGVPEEQLDAIRRRSAGAKLAVQASTDAEPNRVARGVLKVIDNAVDTNTGTIRLKAVFDNADRMLWPGQFVNVVLTLDTQSNATVVPSEAVQDGQRGPVHFRGESRTRPWNRGRSRWPARSAAKRSSRKASRPARPWSPTASCACIPGAKIQPVPAGKVDNLAL